MSKTLLGLSVEAESETLTSRQRFLAACARQPLGHPPLWIMRQAGRYLPEYQRMKEIHGFMTLVRTPELAAKVALLPIHRFGFDAAIVFSDILVLPEAMGQAFAFREGSGIEMEYSISSREQVNNLSTEAIADRLAYVAEAIELTKRELAGETALIGFGGSPWTLAVYMVEGGSSTDFLGIKSMFYNEPQLLESLMNKITDALIHYFEMQIEAGVDAIQIFDSWGGILSEHTYWDASARYVATIIESLERKVPVILFSKGAHHWLQDLTKTGADVFSLDWTASLPKFYDFMEGRAAVQGNLDPAVLTTSPKIVRRETLRILNEFGRRKGHIFNLGHGILPSTKIECVEALVSTVREFNGDPENTWRQKSLS